MIDDKIQHVNDLISMGNLPEAIEYLGQEQRKTENKEDKIDILILLGELFLQMQRYEEAGSSLENALLLLRKNPLKDDNQIFNQALVAYNFSLAQAGLRKTKEAIDTLLDVTDWLDKIESNDLIVVEQKAIAYHELATRFSELEDNYLTRKYAKTAITFYALLMKEDRERFAHLLSNSNVQIAETYENESDLHTAFTYYKSAATVYENLSDKEREAFLPLLAAVYNNMAVTQKQLDYNGKAAEYYQRTLDIYRNLALTSPEEYEPYLAATLNSIGVLYTNLNFKKKGVGFYNDALVIYRRLAKNNPAMYTHYVATTIHNLGVIYDEMGEFDNALKYYNEALDIRRALAEKEPVAFNLDTSVTLLNIVTLYHARLEKEKNLEYRNPALSLLNEAESRLMRAESEKPVIKSMKSDVEYFKEFFEEIDMEKLAD